MTGDVQRRRGHAAHSYVTVATVSDEADHRTTYRYISTFSNSGNPETSSAVTNGWFIFSVSCPLNQRQLICWFLLCNCHHHHDYSRQGWYPGDTLAPAAPNLQYIYIVQNRSTSGGPSPHSSFSKNTGVLAIQLHASSPFPIISKVVPEASYFVSEIEKGP